jgi:succinate dehydrogenase/fumarate reductase-like Fe-S protein
MKMVAGRIDFVEPDSNGKWHREDFVVSDEQQKELVENIKQVAEEILELAFWERRCEDKKCEYCALREMLNQALNTTEYYTEHHRKV